MSWKKITLLIAAAIPLLLILLLLIVISPSLWRHMITYPALDAELEELNASRRRSTRGHGSEYIQGNLARPLLLVP